MQSAPQRGAATLSSVTICPCLRRLGTHPVSENAARLPAIGIDSAQRILCGGRWRSAKRERRERGNGEVGPESFARSKLKRSQYEAEAEPILRRVHSMWWIAVIALAAGLFAGCGGTTPNDPLPSLTEPNYSIEGERIFQESCAPCHGPSGRGDGPAGIALRTRPADLTRISVRNGGRFPAA